MLRSTCPPQAWRASYPCAAELYALSKTLDLPADATRAQLLDAMKDVIVGKAAYFGRFKQ